MASSVKSFFENALNDLQLTADRKAMLLNISDYITKELKGNGEINLNFICPYNSHRSQFAQIWCTYAASYFGISSVHSFSGGTETSCFHRNTIKYLKKTGFYITLERFSHQNPIYKIYYEHTQKPITGFSKRYDDSSTPKPFVAVTIYDSPPQQTPSIPEASKNFPLVYKNPEDYDHTPRQESAYMEVNAKIAGETAYILKNSI